MIAGSKGIRLTREKRLALAALRGQPRLEYGGGPLCGPDWKLSVVGVGAANTELAAKVVGKLLSLQDFFLPARSLNAAPPKLEGTHALPQPGTGEVSDTEIEQTLEKAVGEGVLPDLGGKGIYALFFPRDTTIVLDGSRSCSSFLGYHSNRGNLYYIVVPYPCALEALPCGPKNEQGFYSYVFSHELIEAMTDPQVGSGWTVPSGLVREEVADICEGQCYYSPLDAHAQYPLNPYYTQDGCSPKPAKP